MLIELLIYLSELFLRVFFRVSFDFALDFSETKEFHQASRKKLNKINVDEIEPYTDKKIMYDFIKIAIVFYLVTFSYIFSNDCSMYDIGLAIIFPLLISFVITIVNISIIYFGVINAYEQLICENKIIECSKLLEKHINSSPSRVYLKVMKLKLLLYEGAIDDAQKYCNELYGCNKIRKNSALLNNIRYIIDYIALNNSTSEDLVVDKNDEIGVLLSFIAQYNYGEIHQIPDSLLRLFESKITFLKSASAILISEMYFSLGDLNNKAEYEKKALEYAPSQEMRDYIQKHIYAMNNQIKIT